MKNVREFSSFIILIQKHKACFNIRPTENTISTCLYATRSIIFVPLARGDCKVE